MADSALFRRCASCNAPEGSSVHHVRANVSCYVPQGAVSYDQKVHAPAVTIKLDATGLCGPCGSAKSGGRR